MTKEQIKTDIFKAIFGLNSDISNYDRCKLIDLLHSIVDYTNNIELEQKYNKLTETIKELESRVQALENSSQS